MSESELHSFSVAGLWTRRREGREATRLDEEARFVNASIAARVRAHRPVPAGLDR